MAINLQIENPVGSAAQLLKDQNGNASSLSISTDKVGIGTTNPQGKLDVTGNIVMNGNAKTQLSATADSLVIQGGLIKLDLGSVGGGQLHVGTNSNDDKIYLEGFNRDGTGHAAEMLITGRFAQSLPLFSVLAETTRLLGKVQIGADSINAAFTIEPTDASPNAGYIRFGDNTGWKLYVGRSRESSILNGTPLNTGNAGVLMTIQDNGNIGIGTSAPREKLDVNGHILAMNAGFQGDVEVAGDIRLLNADCAEDFDICETEEVEAGTVMVLGEEGVLYPSQHAYDKRVAGVVSGAGKYKPGIVLDKQETGNLRKPIALLGKVYCKVDAGFGDIEIGDLLTTSPTPGHAMKVTDPLKAFGTVIGKALRPFTDGKGLVPILIALQ